jgi:hypothetical protein
MLSYHLHCAMLLQTKVGLANIGEQQKYQSKIQKGKLT